MVSRALACFILLSFFAVVAVADYVDVRVRGVASISETDDNFVCANLDWWPTDKCDYGQCPWGNAGIFNLDLQNKTLINAVKAFGSIRLRIGGSLQDSVTYGFGHGVKECSRWSKNSSEIFGFGGACLDPKRWDEINDFFNKTQAKLWFGLNALHGKKRDDKDRVLWVGDWDARKTRDLMEYTISKGYTVDSYELGNELSGRGVNARVEAKQYAKDIKKLRGLVNEMYPDGEQPKVLGPGGFYDKKWFTDFMLATEPGVIDGVTHHTYNLGPGDDPTLILKVQDPYYLDNSVQTYSNVADTVKQLIPWTDPWGGEGGGISNSGSKDVSHTFANGFWYLDQLGMTASYSHKVFCRQALIGGHYGLLNTTSFIPNPDYYGALLFHRLMGKGVLSTVHYGSPFLRAYSHCSKNKPGITLLLINMSNSTTFDVDVLPEFNLHPWQSYQGHVDVLPEFNLHPWQSYQGQSDAKPTGAAMREEYHLTPEGGNIQSEVLLLNGTPLKLTDSFNIPELNPKLVNPTSAVSIAPDSFVFVSFKDFRAPACLFQKETAK